MLCFLPYLSIMTISDSKIYFSRTLFAILIHLYCSPMSKQVSQWHIRCLSCFIFILSCHSICNGTFVASFAHFYVLNYAVDATALILPLPRTSCNSRSNILFDRRWLIIKPLSLSTPILYLTVPNGPIAHPNCTYWI